MALSQPHQSKGNMTISVWKSPRLAGQAPPPTTDKMSGLYIPARDNPPCPTRPGSNDAFELPSLDAGGVRHPYGSRRVK